MLLVGLFLITCSASFLTAPKTISPKLAPATMSWVFPHQSPIRKMYHRLANRSVWWTYYFHLMFPIQNDSSLCQIYIKLALSESPKTSSGFDSNLCKRAPPGVPCQGDDGPHHFPVASILLVSSLPVPLERLNVAQWHRFQLVHDLGLPSNFLSPDSCIQASSLPMLALC